jgi:hypothetical protein
VSPAYIQELEVLNAQRPQLPIDKRKLVGVAPNIHPITADEIISQIEGTATEAAKYLFEGITSDVSIINVDKWGNSSAGGATTVKKWFKDHTNIGDLGLALSPLVGPEIYLREEYLWEGGLYGAISSFATRKGEATGYGKGILLHELLHKVLSCLHDDEIDLLNAALPPNLKTGTSVDIISYKIMQICFQ